MPKKYSNEYKNMIVEEVKLSGSISKVAEKYKLSYSSVYKWKQLKDNMGINKNLRDNKKLFNENQRLKELILKKEMEIQKLKDMLMVLI